MSMMSAPASANAIAMACPIPRVPPVTTAVLPTSENSFRNDSTLLSLGERIVGKRVAVYVSFDWVFSLLCGKVMAALDNFLSS
jgi:hypothetical protein